MKPIHMILIWLTFQYSQAADKTCSHVTSDSLTDSCGPPVGSGLPLRSTPAWIPSTGILQTPPPPARWADTVWGARQSHTNPRVNPWYIFTTSLFNPGAWVSASACV